MLWSVKHVLVLALIYNEYMSRKKGTILIWTCPVMWSLITVASNLRARQWRWLAGIQRRVSVTRTASLATQSLSSEYNNKCSAYQWQIKSNLPCGDKCVFYPAESWLLCWGSTIWSSRSGARSSTAQQRRGDRGERPVPASSSALFPAARQTLIRVVTTRRG